jgi:hypothetical protein
MERLFNIPIRKQDQNHYTEDFAKKAQKIIFDQVARGKVRGMRAFELTVQSGEPVVTFLLPEPSHVG